MPRPTAPPLTTHVSTYVPAGTNAHRVPAAFSSEHTPASVVEAKLVVLGAQGVGKTSLVNRFVNPGAPLSAQTSTIGASFTSTKIYDPDTSTTVRLQLWDTAGQERFRSISKLYYRGANAGILCYDVTSEQSWEEMKTWLEEMREHCEFSFNESRPGSGMVSKLELSENDLIGVTGYSYRRHEE